MYGIENPVFTALFNGYGLAVPDAVLKHIISERAVSRTRSGVFHTSCFRFATCDLLALCAAHVHGVRGKPLVVGSWQFFVM